jgi:hypothetical protein
MNPDDRRLTAIHEAGHAVACGVLARRAYHPVSILPDAVTLGRCRAGGLVLRGVVPVMTIGADIEVQVLVAGFAAEEVIGEQEGTFIEEMDVMYGCFGFPPNHDFTIALAWLEAAGLHDLDDRFRRLDVLYRRMLRFMQRADVQAAVAVLVDRLLDVGVIGEIGVSPMKWEEDSRVMDRADGLVARLAARRWRDTCRRLRSMATFNPAAMAR